jgi:tetratricopeptide (TPR) repeat protein
MTPGSRCRARNLPWLCAVLMLAGCAAGQPAPVEDRTRAAGASEGAGAESGAPSVGVLEPSAPLLVRPLDASTGDGAPTVDAPRQASPDNPAVVALLNRANQDARAGRHDVAAASLERAIKIDPGNAWLWHRLAGARLDQGRAGEAASLAAKSNALAVGDAGLQARNWRLIARVHRQRGEDVAARAAERRARELDNPPS